MAEVEEKSIDEYDPNTNIILEITDDNNETSHKMTTIKVAKQSEIIKGAIEDTHTIEEPIPLGNIKSHNMDSILEYLHKHAEAKEIDDEGKQKYTEDDLKSFEDEFWKELEKDVDRMIEVIFAANYLNLENLTTNGCNRIAEIIKGKTPQELRDTFGIENDFTPEEEAEIQRQNTWSFEGD